MTDATLETEYATLEEVTQYVEQYYKHKEAPENEALPIPSSGKAFNLNALNLPDTEQRKILNVLMLLVGDGCVPYGFKIEALNTLMKKYNVGLALKFNDIQQLLAYKREESLSNRLRYYSNLYAPLLKIIIEQRDISGALYIDLLNKLMNESVPKSDKKILQHIDAKLLEARAFLEEAMDDGKNYDYCNLSGFDLSEENLLRASFRYANLQHANLQGADLRGADLSGENLQGENLQGAKLQGAKLQGANLEGANLEGADFYNADLSGANLQHANLQGAKLWGADLHFANLQGANLQHEDLNYAKLRGANLQGATLWGADLHFANLQGANLEGANLRGAKLQDADLIFAKLQGAKLQGAKLQGADLKGTNFTRADLRDARLDIKNYFVSMTFQDVKVNSNTLFFETKEKQDKFLQHFYIIYKELYERQASIFKTNNFLLEIGKHFHNNNEHTSAAKIIFMLQHAKGNPNSLTFSALKIAYNYLDDASEDLLKAEGFEKRVLEELYKASSFWTRWTTSPQTFFAKHATKSEAGQHKTEPSQAEKREGQKPTR